MIVIGHMTVLKLVDDLLNTFVISPADTTGFQIIKIFYKFAALSLIHHNSECSGVVLLSLNRSVVSIDKSSS